MSGFLENRLRREVGGDGVRDLHRRLARWAEDHDWRQSCHHFAAANDSEDLHRVIEASVDRVVGSGEVQLAADYLERFEPQRKTAGIEIIRSRVDFQSGNLESAVTRADRALVLAPEMDAALNNASTMHSLRGELDIAWDLSKTLAATAQSSLYKAIGEATCGSYETSLDGNIDDQVHRLTRLAAKNRAEGLTHFLGISLHNLAVTYRCSGEAEVGLEAASEAADALERSSSEANFASALITRAWFHAHLGSLNRARMDLERAAPLIPSSLRGEWLVEAADIEVSYGRLDLAEALLHEAEGLVMHPAVTDLCRAVGAELSVRAGDYEYARLLVSELDIGRVSDETGHKSRQLAVVAHLGVVCDDPRVADLIADANRHARNQGAGFWVGYCRLLSAARAGGSELDSLISQMQARDMVHLSILAELVGSRLADLGETNLTKVAIESSKRPERWHGPLRRVAGNDQSPSRWRAAELLDVVGTAEDVVLLRGMAREGRRGGARTTLGRTLARRLAPRVFVEDLGRVEIRVGSSIAPGTDLRRKVLGMLCFLLTRPGFSATRDEVIDALWPDMSPDVAVNSLNQTVYFLRRVFEPNYKDDLSAGYVHHSSDVLWLDPDLVSSRSRMCQELIESLGNEPTADQVETLSGLYQDRFALDFAYEDWAVPFRSSLHVSYLQIIEAAVTRDMSSGHHQRAIRLARHALEIDPTVESLELLLLRLYRTTGAHAAAAEQYLHYSAFVRDELGIEPPPLASL